MGLEDVGRADGGSAQEKVAMSRTPAAKPNDEPLQVVMADFLPFKSRPAVVDSDAGMKYWQAFCPVAE
jgi:hypothetical protein